MSSGKTLVWLKPRFLGDAVMATPLIRVLGGSGISFSVLMPPHIAELLREDLSGGLLLPSAPLRPASAFLKEVRRIRKMRFSRVLLVNRSFRSALISKLAGIRVRVGHDTEGRGILLTHRVKHDEQRHEAESYGDLALAVGLEGEFTKVMLTATAQESAYGREVLGENVVGIQPGASYPAKAVPIPALVDLVRAVQARGLGVVLLGGKEEEGFGTSLLEALGEDASNLIGKCSLRQTIGVTSNLSLCVGGCTGLTHISAATGCPTVKVFGPTLSSRWGHNYAPHTSIQVEGGLIDRLSSEVLIDHAMKALSGAPIRTLSTS